MCACDWATVRARGSPPTPVAAVPLDDEILKIQERVRALPFPSTAIQKLLVGHDKL